MEEEQIKAAFNKIDTNGDGKISQEEFSSILQEISPDFNTYKAKKVFKKLDANKDGEISYDEFKLWWKSGHEEGIEQLVFLSLQVNNVLKKVSDKISQSGGIQSDDDVQEQDIQISVGQSPPKSYLGFEVLTNQEAQQLQQKSYQGFSIFNENSVGIVIRIGCQDGNAGKEVFSDLMEQILSTLEAILPPEIADNYLAIVKHEVITKENDVYIGITADHNLITQALQQVNSELESIPKDAQSRLKFLVNLGFDFKTLIDSKDQPLKNVLNQLNFDINLNLKLQSYLYDLAKGSNSGSANKVKKLLGGSTAANLIISGLALQKSVINLQYKNAEKLFGSSEGALLDALNMEEGDKVEKVINEMVEELNLGDKTGEIPMFEELAGAFQENGTGELSIQVFAPRVAAQLQTKLGGVSQLYNLLYSQ